MAKYWLDVEDLDDPTDPFALEAVESASWILYKLTGEKYPGINKTTECFISPSSSLNVSPQVINGRMYNLPTGVNRGSARELYLGSNPVVSVEQVTINGTILPKEAYKLRNRSFIIKSNNTYWTWPANQELCVSYTYGERPPAAGRRAAIRLANELVMAANGDDECSIPEIVSSLDRQGISYQMPDPGTYIEKGHTGISSVDSFIYAANPTKAKKKVRLLSPDRLIRER